MIPGDKDFYKERLQLHKNTQFVRITHTDAIVATVYTVAQAGTPAYILKVCSRTQDYFHELYFLQFFAKTSVPVPRIIQTIPPKDYFNGAILMEYIPGAIVQTQNITSTLVNEIGTVLAQIHTHKTSGFGDLTQPPNLTPSPRTHFTAKFYENIQECRGHLPVSLLEQCCSYYEAHCKLLASIDGPCIIHRDFRPANIIVRNNAVQGIIDWSSARTSFAEQDFCSIEHEKWLGSHEHKEAFLTGYSSVRPIPNYNTTMPLMRLNKALAFIGFVVKRNMWQDPAIQTGAYQANRTYLEHFFTE